MFHPLPLCTIHIGKQIGGTNQDLCLTLPRQIALFCLLRSLINDKNLLFFQLHLNFIWKLPYAPEWKSMQSYKKPARVTQASKIEISLYSEWNVPKFLMRLCSVTSAWPGLHGGFSPGVQSASLEDDSIPFGMRLQILAGRLPRYKGRRHSSHHHHQQKMHGILSYTFSTKVPTKKWQR